MTNRWRWKCLKKYIAKIYFLELKGVFTDPFEAQKAMDTAPVDILFLDIQMPDINGIEFSRIINKKNTAVVFTTAFSEYAVEGFNVDAIDYLLKPIEYDRFLKAVYKAKEYVDYLTSQELQEGYIFVKSDYQMVKVNLKEILYIEGLDDYIKIYLPGQVDPDPDDAEDDRPEIARAGIYPGAPLLYRAHQQDRAYQQEQDQDRRQGDTDRRQL